MSHPPVLVALALAIAVLAAGRPRRGLPRGSQALQSSTARTRVRVVDSRVRRLSAMLLGLAVALVLGGWFGVFLGLLSVLGVERLLPHLTRGDDLHSARLRAQVPLAGDLLVAVLRSGAPIAVAAESVGRAVGGPLGPELVRVARGLALGAPPREAMTDLLLDPTAALLVRPLLRAAERGSPPAAALGAAMVHLRREAEDEAVAAAEVAAVRAVGPLGVCFLPAFVLLAVVPLVAGLAGSLFVGL